MQVMAIGDSIVGGGIDPAFGGWVNRLKIKSMSLNRGDHVFNLGLGGNTSRDILARAPGEIAARVKHVRNVIIGTGTNDMNLEMPLTEFSGNLTALADLCAGHGLRTFFIGLFQRTDRDAAVQTAAYDGVIQEVCRKSGATYIATADIITPADLCDGVHPDARGHAKIAVRVATFMQD